MILPSTSNCVTIKMKKKIHISLFVATNLVPSKSLWITGGGQVALKYAIFFHVILNKKLNGKNKYFSLFSKISSE